MCVEVLWTRLRCFTGWVFCLLPVPPSDAIGRIEEEATTWTANAITSHLHSMDSHLEVLELFEMFVFWHPIDFLYCVLPRLAKAREDSTIDILLSLGMGTVLYVM
ncbi:hypothetical protein P171DRAFT_430786 [Karstenula rhodostoma CBS 690.94]|uniref:EXPERA domain-containing protein n=1 Tax=Karstenula rhodostoma CBS 690.94 TaxID=1392251 RepID=A0A9P4UB97_9PLEO|nr:hypothetical protein P171DRAFT_430786 [Karstenula rhodostoma CBS 690.94]